MHEGALGFGDFELDLAQCQLTRNGSRVKLERIPMDLLILLVENRGRVVSREEIVARLWGRDTFVDTENNVNAAVRKIRHALSDSPEQPLFVRTITGTGYSFIASVSAAQAVVTTDIAQPVASTQTPQPEVEATPGGTERGGRGMRRRVAIAAGLAGAVSGIGGIYALYDRRRLHIRSIAVLPLENLTGNPAYEYFSDGMTDALIGELARMGSLQVISRTSVMQYKGSRNKSLPVIAKELNVQAIVQGTVSQSAARVRITAQLIDAREDRHIWSDRYERDFADVLALQEEVALAIAREIHVHLPSEQRPFSGSSRRVNPEAFEAYLKGSFYLHKGILGVKKSIEFFTEAIKLDQNGAEAYAGLAEALCYAGIFEILPSSEAFPQARDAALKGLELDDSNAAAHNALADVLKGYDWNLQGALAEYRARSG